MPLDQDDADSSTIFTNHAQYHTDWMHEVLEPILDGTMVGGTPADIRTASASAREQPECWLREDEGVFDRVRALSESALSSHTDVHVLLTPRRFLMFVHYIIESLDHLRSLGRWHCRRSSHWRLYRQWLGRG